MNKWKVLFKAVTEDKVYYEGITYGHPREGHWEGTIANHIQDLEGNLSKLVTLVTDEEHDKLLCLIHIHDTFKKWAKKNSSIQDPLSHASLAVAFARRFITPTDPEMQDFVNMIQFHDTGYSLYQSFEQKGRYNIQRLKDEILTIVHLDLFMLFVVIDGYTPSKDAKKIRWFVEEVLKHRTIHHAVSALTILGI